MNIKGKVSREDRENARLDRDRALNPADEDPGMGDFDWDSFDSDSSSGGTNSWGDTGGSLGDSGGGGFGSDSGGFGGGGFGGSGGFGGGSGFGDSWGSGGGGFGGFGQPEPPKKNDEELEDKIFKGIGTFFKGFFNFTKDFTTSFKTFNYMSQLKMGRISVILGGLLSVIGLLLTLFGFGSVIGLDLIIGGLTSLGIGIIVFMIAYDTFNKNGGVDNPDAHAQFDSQPQETIEEPSSFEDFSFNSSDTKTDEDDEYNLYDFDDEEEDEEEFDFFIEEDEEEETDFNLFDNMEVEDSEDVKNRMDLSLATLDSNNGMYTRLFLYEKIENSLVNVNQTFDKARNITDSSDEFDDWDAIIQNSANLFKPKGNDIEYPYLVTAKEKIFYYLLEVKRVNWLKTIDSFVTEIVNICAYNEETGVTDKTIYGVANTVGDRIYIKIMKGATAMVSVKDTYKRVGEDIKNSKNYMPIVLGLDAEGNVVWRDFKDINSILVTGMPRSGKTWLVQSIISQMTFYLKPSELHIHILDPKEQISDYKAMKIPHIRKFVSTDASILQELRHIVKVEGPRRKQIIGGAGFVNIWDYRKKNPDVDLPLLYVVIDEVITLAERMDKETKDEFQSLLLELVSQLPALGIRIFMIPHVVKDQILKKSITDLIPCRISVRGDADHIEKSVGVKNFKHKLFHQGDMAVRFNNDEPMFVHSAVLTTSNEGNQELFDFLTKFWMKLDEEGYEGSLHWQEATGFNARNLTSTSKADSVHQQSSKQQRKVDITMDISDNSSNTFERKPQTSKKLSNEDISELVNSTKLSDDDGTFDLFE